MEKMKHIIIHFFFFTLIHQSQLRGVEGLINEINIMREINSEYCLKLYETYETNNSIYLVVDLLSGGELLD